MWQGRFSGGLLIVHGQRCSISIREKRHEVRPRGHYSDAELMFLKRYVGRVSGASVSPIFEFSCRFARTIILSRLLTPHDLGAATALVTILACAELITDVGLGQFVIVQAGQNPAQSVAVVRRMGIA